MSQRMHCRCDHRLNKFSTRQMPLEFLHCIATGRFVDKQLCYFRLRHSFCVDCRQKLFGMYQNIIHSTLNCSVRISRFVACYDRVPQGIIVTCTDRKNSFWSLVKKFVTKWTICIAISNSCVLDGFWCSRNWFVSHCRNYWSSSDIFLLYIITQYYLLLYYVDGVGLLCMVGQRVIMMENENKTQCCYNKEFYSSRCFTPHCTT